MHGVSRGVSDAEAKLARIREHAAGATPAPGAPSILEQDARLAGILARVRAGETEGGIERKIRRIFADDERLGQAVGLALLLIAVGIGVRIWRAPATETAPTALEAAPPSVTPSATPLLPAARSGDSQSVMQPVRQQNNEPSADAGTTGQTPPTPTQAVPSADRAQPTVSPAAPTGAAERGAQPQSPPGTGWRVIAPKPQDVVPDPLSQPDRVVGGGAGGPRATSLADIPRPVESVSPTNLFRQGRLGEAGRR